MCQCHGLALLGGSVDVVFPSVVLVFTLSYQSLSTAHVVTEHVFCMYEVPWFCSSVLGITTYQSVLLYEMVYIILYINFYFVLKAPHIMGSLVWHLSFCSQSQYQCGAILPADVCVAVVRRLYIWYYPVVSRVSWCFLLCNAFLFYVR